MSDFYEVLIAELRDDPLGVGYANMTDQQVAASLNEPRFSVPTTRFITWRAIAAVLDDDEYAAVKAALNQLAQVSPKVADMIPFLSQATGDDGTGGGIDYGHGGNLRPTRRLSILPTRMTRGLQGIGFITPCATIFNGGRDDYWCAQK